MSRSESVSVFVSDVPAARFRVSTDLQPAENLYVVGYPRGTQLGVDAITVTRGIFSARRQARNDVWHVQTDARWGHSIPRVARAGRVAG